MTELLIFLSGYAVGVLVSVILYQPMKEWQDGYDTAKKIYDNWDKGFDEGWHCAEKKLTEGKDERI